MVWAALDGELKFVVIKEKLLGRTWTEDGKMQEYPREQVDWPQAFREEGYGQRLATVRTPLKAAALD